MLFKQRFSRNVGEICGPPSPALISGLNVEALLEGLSQNGKVKRLRISCPSLTNLSLSFCNIKIDEDVNVQWNQLKSLTIEEAIDLSEDAMNRILCGAPLLQELILWHLINSGNLNIRSTSLTTLKIRKVDVAEGTMLRIWAPNLLTLEISACVYGTLLLDVPSLTCAVIRFEEDFEEDFDMFGRRIDMNLPSLQMFDQFFRSLRHVGKLTLSDLSIQILLKMKENHMVANFSNTKFLKLSVYSAEVEGLLHVLAMFPELLNLVVERDEYRYYDAIDREPHVAMVDALNMTFPNPSLLQLKTVEITWSKCPTSIIPMVHIMLQNAHVLEKMVLRLRAGRSDSQEKIFTWSKKVIKSMPRSSPIAKIIIR